MAQSAAALEKDDRWTCPVYPLWAMYSEACSPNERGDSMSLFTVLWLIMTATGFSVYSTMMLLGVLNHGADKLNVATKFRDAAFELNKYYEYWTHEERRWSRNQLIRFGMRRVFVPMILMVSFRASLNLVNQFGRDAGCPERLGMPALGMLDMMISGERNADRSCNTTELSLGATFICQLF